MKAEDFDMISQPDGTCHFFFCGKPGVLLAYDKSFPQMGLWFCTTCWDIFSEVPMLIVVEDKRQSVGEQS